MKTTAVTPADLRASVIAVPPLARESDLSLNEIANRALIRHVESGGVRSLMYGGNANFFNVPLSEYARTLDFLEAAVGKDTWLLPSAGPDYGKLIDQAAVLRERRFPTAMVLPAQMPLTDAGVARAIRRFAEILGKQVVVYIKADNQISVGAVGALIDDGIVCSVKYGTVRSDPKADPYLRALVDRIGTDILVSGIGERPAIAHWRDFGLRAFTSGSVCVAPRASMKLLSLLKNQRFEEAEKIRSAFLPLEDLRDAMGAIRVLHDAVTLAGIADMGAILPLLSNLESAERARVLPAAKALLAYDTSLLEEKTL
jgi:dihydrodipicolinate synthase/N-acetylneuraminate lyase